MYFYIVRNPIIYYILGRTPVIIFRWNSTWGYLKSNFICYWFVIIQYQNKWLLVKSKFRFMIKECIIIWLKIIFNFMKCMRKEVLCLINQYLFNKNFRNWVLFFFTIFIIAEHYITELNNNCVSLFKS